MYEVFLNERIISIAAKKVVKKEKAGIQEFIVLSLKEVCGIVNHFLKSDVRKVFLINKNVEKLMEEFKNCFIHIEAAGGVVRKGNKLLFIYRQNRWDLPKGKIDDGETPEEAAIREVEEECGISGLTIVTQLTTTWHVYLSSYPENNGKWILKNTYWYEMNYDGCQDLVPQKEEDISNAEWVGLNESDKIFKNTYASLKSLIENYF